jgi:hypothetical protein
MCIDLGKDDCRQEALPGRTAMDSKPANSLDTPKGGC